MIVVMASKKSGLGTIYGYFKPEEAMPEGWKVCDTSFNIDTFIKTFGSEEAALKAMNQHWRE